MFSKKTVLETFLSACEISLSGVFSGMGEVFFHPDSALMSLLVTNEFYGEFEILIDNEDLLDIQKLGLSTGELLVIPVKIIYESSDAAEPQIWLSNRSAIIR